MTEFLNSGEVHVEVALVLLLEAGLGEHQVTRWKGREKAGV